MSDFPEGTDWWKASDGLWYAPPATENGEPPPLVATPAEERELDRREAERRASRGCLIGLAAVVVLVIWMVSSAGDNSSGPSGPTIAGAEDVCSQAVKDELRAPATADITVEGRSGSGSRYTLTGVVDSENGFGALVRSTWSCTATHVSGTQWRTNVVVV